MQLWMIINFSGHVHAMNLPQMGVDYCAALAACCTVPHAVKGYTMGEGTSCAGAVGWMGGNGP